MIRAGKTLLLAGMPDLPAKGGSFAAFEGRKGGLLWALSAADGRKLADHPLDAPPVWSGLAAAAGRLYMTTTDGKVRCFGPK
jgi:hypothetical protein